MKRIYLASPYGFSEQQKALLLPQFVTVLSNLGAEVWEPFARNNQVDFSEPDWAYGVAMSDAQDVRDSDAIFAIVNGTPPDEGVMVELGIAIALKKKIFLFRDDFRKCTDSGKYPLNLMLFSGLPKEGWQEYFYTSLGDVSDPNRPLARWLQSPSG